MKNNYINHILGIFLFFLPFSKKILIWDKNAYLAGNFNEYCAFFLNHLDLFILTTLIFIFILIKEKKILFFPKIPYPILLILIWSIFLLGISSDPILHFLSLLRLFAIVTLFNFLNLIKINFKIPIYYFLASMSFVSFIAIFQIIMQHNSIFTFLGEPYLRPDILGVAKINLIQEKMIRAYGTLSHPNILGFFSLISFYLSKFAGFKNLRYFFFIPLICSFSRSAWLALGISQLFFFKKKNFKKTDFLFLLSIISLAFIFFKEAILNRLMFWGDAINFRLEGIISATKILWQNPWGVGLNHFLLYLQNFSEKLLFPWEFQPVHNSYLLFANELGLISLVCIFIFLFYFWKKTSETGKKILLTIMILGCFDHYLWSSSNAFLLSCFGLFLTKNK